MKKILTWCLTVAFIGITANAQAQKDEIAQLLLNVEKLAQFKQILSDLKKGYEIVHKGYSTIKDLSEGNFNIHKTFLDGLMEVSPAVRKYRKVAEIVEYQIKIVDGYKKAIRRFRASGRLSATELDYLQSVYDNLINLSLRNLDQLTNVVTAGKLRMSDDERLKAIDDIHADMSDKLDFINSFNASTSVLIAQRTKVAQENNLIKGMTGIK